MPLNPASFPCSLLRVGTVTYMSPERISGKPYSFDSDCWSLGLSLVECATGCFPYPPAGAAAAAAAEPLSFWDLLDYIVQRPPPVLRGEQFSKEFVDFVYVCLRKDPRERATAQQLRQHAWLAPLDEGGPGASLAEQAALLAQDLKVSVRKLAVEREKMILEKEWSREAPE